MTVPCVSVSAEMLFAKRHTVSSANTHMPYFHRLQLLNNNDIMNHTIKVHICIQLDMITNIRSDFITIVDKLQKNKVAWYRLC